MLLPDVLINLVRERRAIYNPCDPMHRDRDAIVALWKDIDAEIICTSVITILFSMLGALCSRVHALASY